MSPPRLYILPVGERHPAWHGLTEADLWPGQPLPYLEPVEHDLSTPLAAALSYARLGWRVHPCHWITASGSCSCRETDCKSAGKHPILTAWQKRATTEPALIERWWQRTPDANLAVATGPGSGIFVLDVDGAAGERSLVELERGGETDPEKLRHRENWRGEMPELYPMQWTGGGRGGWQAFLAWPDGRQIGNSAGRLGAKLDTRGQGGYVLLPPSITIAPYRWAEDRDPWTLPPEPAPAWLLDLLDPPEAPESERPLWTGADRTAGAGDRYLERAIAAELALVASAPDGRRNDQLNESAFSLFRFAAEGRIAAGSIAAGLEAAARHAGLAPREIASTLKSAATKRGVDL